MRTWTEEELARLAATEEIEIAPVNDDGMTGRFTPIWVVRSGDALFVRSYVETGSKWYRAATEAGTARVRVGGVEFNVGIRKPSAPIGEITAQYESKYAKYAKYAGSFLDPMIAPPAAASTMELVAT